MPNWCTNELTITGKNAKKFFEANRGKRAIYALSEDEKTFYSEEDIKGNSQYHGFTFNALAPAPQEVLDKGFSKAGYDWQIKNWGTKWDINDKDINHCMQPEDDRICIWFDTAWSPPLPWLIKAAEGWEDLIFELNYYELGTMFCGFLIIENAEVTMDITYEDPNLPEFWGFLYDKFDLTQEDAGYEEEEDEE